MKEIILASASPRRNELFKKLGLDFKVEPSSYVEKIDSGKEPHVLAKTLSRYKATDVASKHKNVIVVGADTIVVLGEEILGKPKDTDDAKAMLKKLSGKPHRVITGFTIVDAENGKIISKSVETKVFFKKLTDEEIVTYVQSGEPMDKAGSYAIQGLGGKFIDKIEGDYNNVVGLPVKELERELKNFV